MQTTNKLALIGYGKMGRLIEQLAPQHGFEVVFRLTQKDNPRGAAINAERFRGIDAAIEFTTPEAAPQNLKNLARARVPAVTGTTGWMKQFDEVAVSVRESDTGLVYSPNFSVGIAVFSKMVGLAAELLKNEDQYGAWAWEIHHDTKKDHVSGTLLQLVEKMKENGYARNIDIATNRAGKHPGMHEIGFDSSADTITLRHVARNREGFAHGALRAARWILKRKGLYTFEDVLFE